MMEYNTVIKEAQLYICMRRFDKALELLKFYIKELECSGRYVDDGMKEYRSFDEPMQEVLYRHLYHTDKELITTKENYKWIYFSCGSVLNELRRYEEAKGYLEKARRWNPVDTNVLYEYAEVFKMQQDLERFRQLTMEGLGLAVSGKAVARAYRNLGYYYVEKQQPRVAVVLFFFSMYFEPCNKHAVSELQYLSSLGSISVVHPEWKEIEEILEREQIPCGASECVTGLAYGLWKQSLKQQDAAHADYFYHIVRGLTGENSSFESVKI